MTDRRSLANALAEAKIDRPAAEPTATEIFDAIQGNVATKSDLEHLEAATKADMQGVRTDFQRLEAHVDAQIAALRAELKSEMALLEHRLLTRLGGLMVVPFGLLFAALRYLPPAH